MVIKALCVYENKCVKVKKNTTTDRADVNELTFTHVADRESCR